MTTKLKWRLGKLPTSDEVLKLVNDKIITKDEAREILFNEVEEGVRDAESYKEEIKFLKEVISKLSSRNTIVETIREVPYYISKPWYTPYVTYCSAANGSNTAYATQGQTLTSIGTATSAVNSLTGSNLSVDSLTASWSVLDQDGSGFNNIESI